jgi:tetratricopeptide (TPR) repeat protein
MAEGTGAVQDYVPLGALLGDLGEFEEADRTYLSAIQNYRGVSPFALAWVCFQLGVLWGETVPSPHPERAAYWYARAIEYLPDYTRARVHLAEIRLEEGRPGNAAALLWPVARGGDPEVPWRLAQALVAQRSPDEAALQREAAKSAFEALLCRHPLAFADHAAEF